MGAALVKPRGRVGRKLPPPYLAELRAAAELVPIIERPSNEPIAPDMAALFEELTRCREAEAEASQAVDQADHKFEEASEAFDRAYEEHEAAYDRWSDARDAMRKASAALAEHRERGEDEAEAARLGVDVEQVRRWRAEG